MVFVKEDVLLTMCFYCKKLCCHVNNPYLTCELCANNIHIKCLKSGGHIPGGLIGDVFFSLHCAECNDEEKLTREKLPWITVAILTLYHLSKSDPGKNGFYHFTKDICDFIEANYSILFTSSKKTKNWKGTLAGVLSSFNHTLIESGHSVLGEVGWWKLIYDLPPILILNERISMAVRKRNRELARLDNCLELPGSSTDLADCDLMERSSDQPSTSHNDMYSQAYVEPTETLSNILFEEDVDEIDIEGGDMETHGFDGGFVCDFSIKEEMIDLLDLDDILDTKNKSLNQEPQKTLPQEREEFTDVDLHHEYKSETQVILDEDYSNLPSNDWFVQQSESETEDESEDDTYIAPTPPPKSLFTVLPPEIRTSYPWENPNNDAKNTDTSKRMVPMSFFEESQLYERLRRARASHEMPAPVHRLYRKLCLRQTKRQRILPLFNIDDGNVVEPQEKRKRALVSSDVRVLDRFQNRSTTRINRARQECPFAVRLTGEFEATNFYSTYTQRLLKAYIRRDTETVPPWLALMEEMQTKANRKNPDWSLPERWPIDYSYVRPQHIASVNSLCKEFFYPDIDLSETLSYPDFTCVALYKKLVVGFAFMVPDTGFNETYISFLFTRPEWRGSGIATFMLYHLIQTCMGKDITLHVSATNPALLLYQKFGFKIEEYVQDFYDKYFAAGSKECKHALYLRLAR